VRKVLQFQELDSLLDKAAAPLEQFEGRVKDLIEELDAGDVDLEVADPTTWRRGSQADSRWSIIKQFRREVEEILPLDREEEAQLARRIEFARLRLAQAREEVGLEPTEKGGPVMIEGPLPSRVKRRGMELHALRTEMVERNLYLVLINVERYTRSGTSRLDLIQEGSISLFRAVDGFDWRRGLLFRTYAVHWLNQAFRNFLYNNSHTVRVPIYLQKALKHIDQATIRLENGGAAPWEIAEHSDLNESLVRAALTASRASYSIDATGGDSGEGSRLRDLLVDGQESGPYDPRFEDLSLEDGLRNALTRIGEREALVLRLRFGIGETHEHTLAEVAARLGVSVERVRQIQVRALTKLRTPTLRRELAPFVNP
jgi:RNA polymerase primary sigma factor